jgi:uncharacterized protein YbjT (DUF2867 family)
LTAEPAETVFGDLSDPARLTEAAAGADAVVHLTNLLWADMQQITAAYRQAGMQRGVFIGTTNIFATIHPRNRIRRTAAEQAIHGCGFPSTILRPTMIYGDERDRNICRLIKTVRRFPVVPVIGNPRALQQPVYVGDVAEAVGRCLVCDVTAGRTYNISGANPLTFRDMVEVTGRALGKSRVWKPVVPSAPIVSGLRLLEKAGLQGPVRADQFVRLSEDKAYAWNEAARDFGYSPKSFETGVALEVARLRAIGAM